jgi:dolichol-phosphate mannosyltransferase
MSKPLESPWVVIPTYNERKNIERMIPLLFDLGIANLSILIVDDNSPDGTAEAVREFQKTYSTLQLEVREKKSGLGRAYIHGFTYALQHGATAVVQMDADFSHDPNDVPKLLAELENNDLVLGSRYVEGISVVNWPLQRLLISIGGNVYASLITGMPFKDATGGFKAWRATTLQAIDLPTVEADGYGFQIVMTHRVWKKKLRIKEIPIIFTERRVGQSKMSKTIIWEALWLVWKLRLFS